MACAPAATVATSAADISSTSAKRWASSPRSRSASPARSSRCARSTSAVRRRGPRRLRRSKSKSAGTIRFSALMRYVTSGKGDLIVIARSGEVTIHDDNGRERERHKVPYGATLQVKDGDIVKAGKVLATWDATARPIITEYAGTREVRARRGRRDRGQAGRRCDGSVDAGRHRPEAPCDAARPRACGRR